MRALQGAAKKVINECPWTLVVSLSAYMADIQRRLIIQRQYIESLTSNVTAGKISVTAFLDFATFKKFSEQLAWETEVWIADMPDHMIHLNGDKIVRSKCRMSVFSL